MKVTWNFSRRMPVKNSMAFSWHPAIPTTSDLRLALWHAAGVAVVCVASDAPRSERLASVTADAHASGAIAAELFSRTIQKTGHLATITGELTTLDHAEKLRGFAANLAVFAPHLSLLPAIESHEQPKVAYRQASCTRFLASRIRWGST